jgi:hypothetical protein
MRKQAKLYANFLGATKELMSEYVDLAGITEDEQNQIRLSLTSRPDRKETARVLAAKGFSTRKIAELTGWSHQTIMRDIDGPKGPKVVQTDQPRSTTDRAGKEQRAAAVATAAAQDGATPEPTEKYRIIYADPPWSYGNVMPDGTSEPRDHYPVMELDAICALPVKAWTEDNAVLFLWATAPILKEAIQVAEAWGFEHKAQFIWDKIKHNMGHYNSVRHELLLVCTRGSCSLTSNNSLTASRASSAASIAKSLSSSTTS